MYFPDSAGWQRWVSSSAFLSWCAFGYYLSIAWCYCSQILFCCKCYCSQMVKQWLTWSCAFKATCSRFQRPPNCSPLLFLFLLFSAKCVIFFFAHATKPGMKDLLKAQQWWVERDSNLLPPQYRANALTTTPCSPFNLNDFMLSMFCILFVGKSSLKGDKTSRLLDAGT